MDSVPETGISRPKAASRNASSDGAAAPAKTVSHNLNGQRLGRKGRDTRERIISAAQALLASPEPVPITLSAVARQASLGMTSLYLYFSDLTELVLAVLEPVMKTAEDAYIGPMRTRWPDDALNACCNAFVSAYYDFWCKHARLLHLRNSMADQHDRRIVIHRVRSAQQVISLLAEQMDGNAGSGNLRANDMATVLLTGIERTVTLATDADVKEIMDQRHPDQLRERLNAVARLLELGIRDIRGSDAGRSAD